MIYNFLYIYIARFSNLLRIFASKLMKNLGFLFLYLLLFFLEGNTGIIKLISEWSFFFCILEQIV